MACLGSEGTILEFQFQDIKRLSIVGFMKLFNIFQYYLFGDSLLSRGCFISN